MTPEEIVDILKRRFGESITAASMDSAHPSVTVGADVWHDVALCLRDDERIGMNMLRCVSGVDRIADGEIEVIYDLVAMKPGPAGGLWTEGGAIAVKIRVPRDGGHLPSAADVWPAADWHEREAFDMVGVRFDNHPDHRRILCPDDWVGYPLRKDYEFPMEYHGIPGSTEFGQNNPTH